jgi:hypothetical protein
MANRKLAFIVLFFVAVAAWGQSSDSAGTSPLPAASPTPLPQAADDAREASANPVKFLRNIGRDQKAILTSPFKARIEDLNWIVPLTGLSYFKRWTWYCPGGKRRHVSAGQDQGG